MWAIVLAGSLNEGRLKECSNAPSEALIKIGDKCMIEYVVNALLDAERVGKIIIVGSKLELDVIYGSKENVIVVEGGKTIVQSLLNALDLIKDIDLNHVLVVTSDIPLITGKIVDNFVERCSKEDADVVYPVVTKSLNEAKFPGVKRTYVKLREGVFTGGNLFIINPSIVRPCAQNAEELVSLRKSPLRLVNYIGLTYILKYMLRRLSIKDAEARVSQLFNIKGKAVSVPYPEIGIDVDKPSDLELVEKILIC